MVRQLQSELKAAAGTKDDQDNPETRFVFVSIWHGATMLRADLKRNDNRRAVERPDPR
jgi:hypothetical protein